MMIQVAHIGGGGLCSSFFLAQPLKGIRVLAFQLSSSPATQSCGTSAKEQRATGTPHTGVKRKTKDKKMEFPPTHSVVAFNSSADTSVRLAAWILLPESSAPSTMRW